MANDVAAGLDEQDQVRSSLVCPECALLCALGPFVSGPVDDAPAVSEALVAFVNALAVTPSFDMTVMMFASRDRAGAAYPACPACVRMWGRVEWL